MNERPTAAANGVRGFLSRLVRDTRANTLALMTAALIPLAGMVGGGVDISRMYILKTRLQHACDAGALAGRKAMGAGVWTQNGNYPNAQAVRFFEANIENNVFGSSGMSKAFTENAGRVSGRAQATIPMTLMRIFGKTTETIAVTCGTEMRLPNTDVMFVLDVTGSMSGSQPGDTVSRLQALKTAVKCFYEIVARLDTDADCTTGAPTGGTGNQVQIRFGFVPYAVNVNVGKLLKPEWMADEWTYQTRRQISFNTWGSWGAFGWVNCSSIPANTQTTEYRTKSTSGNSCNLETRSRTVNWRYEQATIDVSGLKNGSGWANGFSLPIGNGLTNKPINWDGCIEERETVRASSYWPLPSDANDLNVDMIPTSDQATRWKPMLPDLVYTRRSTNRSVSNWNMARNDIATNYSTYEKNPSSANWNYYCPTEAKKLQQWPDASLFDDYVDSLTPSGNTYHDIGLIWGARLASPTGLFASENAYTPEGGEIERHIIFMTDGDTNALDYDYTAYGVPWFDRRQTSTGSVPSKAALDGQVNERFTAMCKEIQRRNFTLWVIAFGSMTTATEDRLEACATPGRYFKATSAATLQQTFKSIADQISMLRLVQ